MSSGSQVGGVVGAVVGGIIGFYTGNVFAGVQYGYAIGSAVGGYIDPTQVEGPRLTDASAQTSTVGGVIPFGYGVFTTVGNLIWAGPLKEHKEVDDGKGSGQETITYTYTRSYAIGVCQGPISGYRWIKRNGKLVYAANVEKLGLDMGMTPRQIEDLGKASAKFRLSSDLYYGTEAQMPNGTIVANRGVGNVSPFRGLAYIVVREDDLTSSQGAVSQYEFCVVASSEGYVTTPPYPLEVTDAVDSSSETASSFGWSIENGEVTSGSSFVGGIMFGRLIKYDDGAEEVESTSAFVGGGINGSLDTYTAPAESVESASEFVGGGINGELLTYEAPAEAYSSQSTFIGGEIE